MEFVRSTSVQFTVPQANDTLGKVLKGKPVIDPGEIDGLLEGRYAFLNVWRSFSDSPVQVRALFHAPACRRACFYSTLGRVWCPHATTGRSPIPLIS